MTDIAFDNIIVKYENLDNHFNIYDFERDITSTKDSLKGPTIKPLEVEIDSSSQMKFIYRFHSDDGLKKIFGSNRGTYIRFGFKVKKTLDNCLETASTLLDFLNFVSGDDIRTFSLWGIASSISKDGITEPIEIMWQFPLLKRGQNSKEGSWNILYQIKNELQNVIGLWFEFKNRYPVVYKFWSAVNYDEASYLSNKFLMTVGAVEAYHRVAWKKQSKISEEKEAFLSKVKPVIEDAIKNNSVTRNETEKISRLMGDWNKPTLAKRVFELCKHYWEILSRLSIKIGNIECFATRVSRYRNDMAHGNVIIEDTDFNNLYFTFKDLQSLLHVCVLTRLGFSVRRIKKLTHANILEKTLRSKLKMTIEFLDTDVVTAFDWIKNLNLPCKFPKSLDNNPDLILRIVEDVQTYLQKQFDDLELSPEDSQYTLHNFLYHQKIKKSKLLTDLAIICRNSLEDIKENRGGTALAIWAGCCSVTKAISKGSHSRSHIFQVIEKFSTDIPSFGKGAQIGILWKLKKKQFDIDFDEAAVHWSIRKYEKLYYQQINKT